MPKSTRTRFTTLLIIALIAAVPITRVLVGLPPFWGARKATFSPPPQEVIIQAIGPTDKLSPERQRAFEPGPEFQPIPAPGSSDWLAAHNEPGQTFAQFVEQRPNLPDEERNRIYILPLGEFDPQSSPPLDDLRDSAEAFFQLEVKVLPAVALDDSKLTNRINGQSSRRQYLTPDILELLRQKLPPDAYCFLALTMEDLYPNAQWNFVFGSATFVDRVGVFSFARYDPTFHGDRRTKEFKTLLTRRSCKVLFHETGHMFGIRHCVHFSCVMNGSNNLTENDAQPMHLCPVCLRKLSWNRDPDFVTNRYEKLQHVFQRIGLKEEADWITNRRKRIKVP